MYVFGSLFLLLSILTISSIMGTTDFDALYKTNFYYSTQLFLFYGVCIAFAVKTPVIFVNGWLLKAHVESPLGGSILLAAIVLKLSLYGILRIMLPLLPKASLVCTPWVYLVLVITILYASFSTLRTTDVKELVAYSSVCHAAVYVLGVFSNTIQGIEGGILLALGHGFVSPALFICVGGIIYDRTGKRIINYIRGLATYMPVFTLLFFIFTLCNTGIPLSLNFFGEQLSLIGIWQQNPIIACLGATGIVLSACYSIFLYNRLSYGNLSPSLKGQTSVATDINRREYYLLISLLLPTVTLGILPNVILTSLHTATSALLYVVV